MKNYTAIIFVLTFFVSISYSQTTQQTLDQSSLLMQFKGTWEGEYGKDTLLTWAGEPIANNKGLYSYAKLTTKGNIIIESWTLIAYDTESKKIQWFEILTGGVILPYVGEFSSITNLNLYLHSKTELEKIIFKTLLHFISADILEVTETDLITGAVRNYVLKRIAN